MLGNLRIQFLIRSTTITSFTNNFFTNQLGIKYLIRCYSLVKLENLLYAGAGKIDFTQLSKSGVVSDSCPVKTVSVNQLGANNPVEDRFNIGLTQIDDSTSACLFTVLDGHSGTACVHAIVWSLLDYMYASIMSKEKLNTALEQLRAYDLNQPYHLIRRLDFVSPKSNRHLKNQAGPPSNMLSAYMRGRLRHYMEDLYSKHNRIMNPSDCLIDAFKRLDEDLCSTDTPDNLLEIQNTLLSFTPDRYLDNSLSRDLLRVNLSGSVGIAGYVSWYDKLSDYPTELYLANVGDCGAILLREVGPNKGESMRKQTVEVDMLPSLLIR